MPTTKIGELTPDVIFITHTGQQVSIQDYLKRHAVVLYFYPKDHTPICTKEACAFRDAYEDFVKAGATVIGVSADSDHSHQSFAQKYRLPFLLVSDTDGTLRKAFGVPKTMGILPGRVTYVIDKKGIIRHVFSAQLLADQHVKEALAVIGELE